MSEETKSLKKDLRAAVIAETLSRSEGERMQLSEKLQTQLFKFAQSQSGFWGAFQPLPSEPKVDFSKISSSIKCCYPKVSGDQLDFYTDVNQWHQSGLQVQEPINGQKVQISDLSGIFVPALAFQTDGRRLGRGKGYYDRALAQFKGLKVGVCFQFNILNSIPTESHDVGMDFLITDEQIIQPSGGNTSIGSTGDQKSWN